VALIKLAGCTLEPLAHYLKSLAVLRLVHQADPGARGFWKFGTFHLDCKFSEGDLLEWFLNEYRPSPIVSPWNGGSGFFPKDQKRAINAIVSSEDPRFAVYRKTVQSSQKVLDKMGLVEKPDPGDKARLLERLRASWPDEALDWLDACCVLGTDKPSYHPLLGTGGNDGRLEFANNFMQRLAELFLEPKSDPRKNLELLRNSLFGDPADGFLRDKPIGQYLPGLAGGPNTTTGYDGSSSVNPWDYILMLEGTLAFPGAATFRLSDQSQGASFPFTVKNTPAGEGSLSDVENDSSRDEIWLPYWDGKATFPEIRKVLSEGRSQYGPRQAQSGVEFATAVSSLGVERGLRGFQRYAFLKRNGKSYFATPLGDYPVASRSGSDCLLELEAWQSRYRRILESNAGASTLAALRTLDRKILDYCRYGDSERFTAILAALGRLQALLGWSPKLHDRVQPISELTSNWVDHVEDRLEVRLALALSRMAGIRQQVEPVTRWERWDKRHPGAVWGQGSLVDNLIALLRRRCLREKSREVDQVTAHEQRQSRHFSSSFRVTTQDVYDFWEGRCDDSLLEDLFRGFLLLKKGDRPLPKLSSLDEGGSPASYVFSKLLFVDGIDIAWANREPNSTKEPGAEPNWPIVPTVLNLLAAGQLRRALEVSQQKLRGRGYPCKFSTSNIGTADPRRTRRLAASLLFPIQAQSLRKLLRYTKPEETKEN